MPVPPVRLATVSDLLIHVAGLPDADRAAASARIEAALELPARAARAALGLLALDLAAPAPDAGGHVVLLPELASASTHQRVSA